MSETRPSETQRFVCVHGHFYQPPRENPWLEAIEVQDSAAPYHDWNARINHECYAANGSSRILDTDNKIVRIVNNYSRMSFNFGPTLLAWMEKYAPLSYRQILDADRASMERFGGHGSAIAQVYNHVILPLAERRDRITQIRWGIADFEHRFHRKPEGMWLAETAVDLETLDLLAQNGIRFTILAPHQCARVRSISPDAKDEPSAWQDTQHADVDPTQPYLVRTGEGRSIAVFFYDGPTSRAIAFEGLLKDGGDLAHSLLRGFPLSHRAGQLVHIATDGESYGHHHRHGDMALAYGLQWIEENSDVRLTNYGQFLENFPPACEAEIFEDTSWSCSHGIDRWRADCGCGTGGQPTWNQRWRAPLRAALDGLRDGVRPLAAAAAVSLLHDPTAALEDYVQVIMLRTPQAQQSFIDIHAVDSLAEGGHTKILKLMELERHIQLMYTSCGWFFDDLSGIETVQILAYAGRVLQLAAELFGTAGNKLETEFIKRLAEANSNGTEQLNGANIYRMAMDSQKIGLEHVGAQYALVSLFEPHAEKTTQYCYNFHRRSGELLTSGKGRLAFGQAQVSSQITLESADIDFAVLHLGDQNLAASVQRTSTTGKNGFEKSVHGIRGALERDELSQAMQFFIRDFGASGYSLNSLFRDDQRRILKLLFDSTLAEMESTLRTIYEEHEPLLHYLSESGMPKPQALLLAAQFSLNADMRQTLTESPFDAVRMRRLLKKMRADQIALDTVSIPYLASQRILDATKQLERRRGCEDLESAIAILEILRELPLELDLWETQNCWYRILLQTEKAEPDAVWDQQFRELGTKLEIEVDELVVD